MVGPCIEHSEALGYREASGRTCAASWEQKRRPENKVATHLYELPSTETSSEVSVHRLVTVHSSELGTPPLEPYAYAQTKFNKARAQDVQMANVTSEPL